jgi:hypothetical protein
MAKRQRDNDCIALKRSCKSPPPLGLFSCLHEELITAIINAVGSTDEAIMTTLLCLLRTARYWLPALKNRIFEQLQDSLHSDAVLTSESYYWLRRFTRNCLAREDFHTAHHLSTALSFLRLAHLEYTHRAKVIPLGEPLESKTALHDINLARVYHCDYETGTPQSIRKMSDISVCVADGDTGEYVIQKATKNSRFYDVLYKTVHIYSDECDAFRARCYQYVGPCETTKHTRNTALKLVSRHDFNHEFTRAILSNYDLLPL